MKKCLFICACMLFLGYLNAQEFTMEINKSYPAVDSMLVNIDKSGLTSGILYERVFPWARLDSVNLLDEFTAGKDYFDQALYELYLASNQEKFMSYTELRRKYVPDSLQNIVDLGILNAFFHTLNYNPENEETGALRIVDSLFVRIENGEPIFLPHHAFVVSPLKKFLRAKGDENIVFRFSDEFLLEEVVEGKKLTRLTANFGTVNDYVLVDNGHVVDEEIGIAYSEEGVKRLSFTAVFMDGSTLSTFGTVIVGFDNHQGPDGLIDKGFIKASEPFTGYEPNDVPLIGRIDYRIFYRNSATEKKIMKPIIIIDGFDPGDKRKIQDSDPHPLETNEEHRSILEVMEYYDNQGREQSILDTLRSIGYDVVIVNHPTYYENLVEANPPIIDGGADYIERNAMAHIELYKWINGELENNHSNEQLVIVGPSMGGQISRYALAYMEEKYAQTNNSDWQHNCRLWVSVDSPHLGANVPMGAQTLLNILYYFGNSAKAGDFVVNVLGSAAARQQMIEQAGVDDSGYLPVNPAYMNGRTVSQGFSQDRGHPFFTQYYNTLYSNGLPGSKGYPQAPGLRRIAMINGSLANSNEFGNPFVPGGTAINNGTITPDYYAYNSSKVFKMAGYVDFFLGDIHGATLEYYFMPAPGDNHKLAYFKKKDIGLGGWDYYDLYITHNNSRGNLDNAPGGWYHTQQEIAYEIDPTKPGPIDYWEIYNLDQVSSFIPTVSSLGFINPDFNWHEKFDRNLICTNEIPFDNYYGPKINERHTSFTEESFEWFLKELDGDTNYPEPTVYLDNTNIIGPDLVCNQVTYTLPDCTVSVDWWTVSSNLVNVSSDDNSITVEPIDSFSNNGEGYVIAHFAHDSAKKTFWVGVEDPPSIQTIPAGITKKNTGTSTTFNAEPIDPGLQYVWRIYYNGRTASMGVLPKFPSHLNTTLKPNYEEYIGQWTENQISVNWGDIPWTYSVTCQIRNGCENDSSMDVIMFTVEEPDGDPCGEMLMAVYPNPVSNQQINVEMRYPPEDDPCISGPPYYGETTNNLVEIYNLYGELEYKNTFHEYGFTIEDPGLHSGSYILSITSANGKSGQEVIIVE